MKYRSKVTFLKKVDKKISSFVKRKVAGYFMKMILLPFFSFVITFLLPIIIITTIIILFLFIQTINQEQSINEITKNQNEILQERGTTIYTPYNTNGAAESFDSLSSIPHGWPITGRITQQFCSNFIFKNAISYSYHGTKWEDKCRNVLENKKGLSASIQNFFGGFWTNVGTHGAIDIAAPIGTNVYSTAYGEVVKVYTEGNKSPWGIHMDIKAKVGDDYYLIRYAHLSKILKKRGDIVYAGELVALSGNTGTHTTGAHLHYGICKNGNSQSYCYDKNGKGEMIDPAKFAYNYVYNGRYNDEFILNIDDLIGKKVYAGVGKPGESLSFKYDIDLDNIDLDKPVTEKIATYIQIKVAQREGIHPLIIKALHFAEGNGRLVNPKAKYQDGWSGLNEGVYGIYNDFTSLTPYCKKTEDNFGKMDGRIMSIKEFQNQTICATKVLKYKIQQKSDIKNYSEKNLDISNDNARVIFCNGISGYNPGPFYCWNNLYPTYTNNESYGKMPVYVKGKLLNYHTKDGILKYMLDNKEGFDYILDKYNKKNDVEEK